MAAEGTQSNGAGGTAPLMEHGVAAGKAAGRIGGGDPDRGADLEAVGEANRELVEVENGRENGGDMLLDPIVERESNGCDLEASEVVDGEGGARVVAGAASVQEKVAINGKQGRDVVQGGRLYVEDEHVGSHDLDVAVACEDGEGETQNGSVNGGFAAVECLGSAERSVELVLEQYDNGAVSEHEVCEEENVSVEVGKHVEIKGGGLGDLADGVDETAGLHVEPTRDVVLSEPERCGNGNPREEVGDVQISGREDLQDEGNSAPVGLESSPVEEEVASSMQEPPVGLHDKHVSHTENEDALTLHIEAMPVIACVGGEVEAEGQNDRQQMVCDDKKTDVNGTYLDSFIVGSIDCEIHDIVSSPATIVPLDIREGQAPLGSLLVEVNDYLLDEGPGSEVGEENKDGFPETRENVEVCSIDDMEPQSKLESSSIELEELASSSDVKAESLKGEFRENVGEDCEDETSLSVEREAHCGKKVDVASSFNSNTEQDFASSFDSNTEQELEVSNNVDVHTREGDATSSDGYPTEQDHVHGIGTVVILSKEDCVCDTATPEFPIEKEASTHGTTTIEICRDSPPVKVGDDVQRETKLDEENLSASVNQDKLSSDDDDEKQALKEDDIKDGIHENGVVAPSTIEDTAGLGIGSRFFMIRIPKFQDEKLGAQIQHAEACLEERTRKRHLISTEIRDKMASFDEYKKNIIEARNEERAAREAFFSKQQEVNAVHSTADKIEIANSIDNVDDRVQYLSHRMQHETISLKEEKQLMREIKELKQKRDHLSKLTPQSEMQKAFEQKDQIEDSLKRLRPELEHLRKELSRVETKIKAARKKFDDESEIVEGLRRQRKAADDLRQEAYIELQNLKKLRYEKNKLFYKYKDDMKAAVTYALSGDKEALQKHCHDQVEGFMELWNNNDEFRNQYVLANQNSTIKRFRTLDGRSLGTDEQPVSLPNATERRAESRTEAPPTSDVMQPDKRKQDITGKILDYETVPETSGHLANGKLADRSENMSRIDQQLTVSSEEAKAEEEERERKRIEDAELKRLADELARTEELRKEQAAAELKEKIRQEQIAKAREAEERKRRKVEKAKVAAEVRARKEAELKEKKRAKKEKQKENKASSTTEVSAGTSTPDDQVPDSVPDDVEDAESSVAAMSRKHSRAPQVAKQQYKKIKPLPAPLLSRRKRRMPTWIVWALLPISLACTVYLVFFRNRPLWFGF